MAKTDANPSASHHSKKKRTEEDSSTTETSQKPIQLQRRRVWRACESCRCVRSDRVFRKAVAHPLFAGGRRSSAMAVSLPVRSALRRARHVHGSKRKIELPSVDSELGSIPPSSLEAESLLATSKSSKPVFSTWNLSSSKSHQPSDKLGLRTAAPHPLLQIPQWHRKAPRPLLLQPPFYAPSHRRGRLNRTRQSRSRTT